ncbi:MAG: HTH domain-containing protein [Actinomycetota bacterium]|nr:HTH domain-containing protein [Actinomycetota bacterium]
MTRALCDHLFTLGTDETVLTNQSMAEALGCSTRTIVQALNTLAAAGIIERVYRAPDRTSRATASGRVIILHKVSAA